MEADLKTGDGAGVLTQIPYGIFLEEAARLGPPLTNGEELAVGVFFLPLGNDVAIARAKALSEEVLRRRGLGIIGWRQVPVRPDALGAKARQYMPDIQHLLVKRGPEIDGDRFERCLYMSRREIENRAKQENLWVYVCSFSHRTISYKALALPGTMVEFYEDFQNPSFETAICMFHQRFSTNTFPSWTLAQPFRMLAHNGEINTLKGNRNWLNSSEQDFESELWGDDVCHLKEVADTTASDSASLDSALELLVLSGRSVPHAMAMLVPPAWRIDPETTQAEKEFYQYHRCFQEPWDGPAALVFTDGRTLAACLDRNGLRPSRFKLTQDDIFFIGSEVGTVEFDDATVIRKGRLAPGEMIAIDTVAGTVTCNRELKQRLAAQQPYGEWLDKHRLEFGELVSHKPEPAQGSLTSFR